MCVSPTQPTQTRQMSHEADSAASKVNFEINDICSPALDTEPFSLAKSQKYFHYTALLKMHYEGCKHTHAYAVSPWINKASGRPFQKPDDSISATVLVRMRGQRE